MLNGKELQVGKSYQTRGVGVVTLVGYTQGIAYPWESNLGNCYDVNGKWDTTGGDIKYDLLEEFDNTTEDFNVVTKPKHYQLIPEKNIEVKHIVAVLADRLGTNGYNGAFIADFAQKLQYGMRFDEKNGLEDLKKEREFLNNMIENYPDVQTLKGQK